MSQETIQTKTFKETNSFPVPKQRTENIQILLERNKGTC